jgi:hypothetical protein
MDEQLRNNFRKDHAEHRLQEAPVGDYDSRVEPKEEGEDLLALHEAPLYFSLLLFTMMALAV